MIPEIFTFFLFHSKPETQYEFYIHSTAQLALATFPPLSSHMWIGTIILHSAGLHVQDDPLVDTSYEPFSDLGLVSLLSTDCHLSFFFAHSPPLFSKTLFSPCPSPTSLIIPAYGHLILHSLLKELAFPKVLFSTHCLSLSIAFTWTFYLFFMVLTIW